MTTIAPSARAASLVPCLQELAPHSDFEGAFPDQELAVLLDNGLLSAPTPREFGGEGLGTTPGTTRDLLETLWHIGRGNLSVGRLLEGHVNALQLVSWFGSRSQQERLFADARAGLLFGVWNTQAGDGVRFERAGSNWQMRGAKTFCSGAPRVSRAVVTGDIVTGDGESAGWQMAVVPLDEVEVARDASFWQPLGMRASASFRVDFSGALLQPDALLGEPNDYYEQPAFSGGATRFCAVQLGGAASLLEHTRACLRAGERAGDPFQQARVGRMAARVQSGWQWLESAAGVWEAREANAAQTVAFAAMMRLATEEICLEVLAMAEQSVGARGLLRPCPIERIGRDLRLYLKQPHLDEIPLRVGRWALESNAPAHQLWTIANSTAPGQTPAQASRQAPGQTERPLTSGAASTRAQGCGS